MATDLPPAPPALEGQVLFYKSPEPLDSNRHARLAMRATDRPYSFAAKQHFCPLQVAEFAPAAVNYPIIFAGESRAPLAIMGLNEGENLFIAPDGLYRVGAYVPSFMRRYPFVVARDGERMVVCIDRPFGLFTDTDPAELEPGSVMLFENGQPSEFTQRCIEFCRQFDQDGQRTQSFLRLLEDLNLFEPRQTNYAPRLPNGEFGPQQLVAEYMAVSEEKLRALPSEKKLELQENGALAQIHAHLISLHNWDKLIGETVARQNPQPANA
jgi:hypothetical protein